MVLNGSLHEYILADILQLLCQQKATGRLVLTTEKRTGFLVLREGFIIAAEDDGENLQSKIVCCLLTVKRAPESLINSLAVAMGATIHRSCAEILARQMMSPAELTALAQMATEDFVCSLFSWRSGEYQFESLTSVAEYTVPNVAISADYMVMEAMRRIDETKEIRSRLSDDTIFVQASQQSFTYTSDVVSLLSSPEYYILYFVDGLSTVSLLSQRTCLTRYRMTEILHVLWQHDLIAPLSSKLSRSIQAALVRKRGEGGSSQGATARAVGLTVTAAILALITGMVIRGTIGPFPVGTVTGGDRASALVLEKSQRKTRAAALEYRMWSGTQPTSVDDIVRAGMLSPADAVGVPLSLLRD